MKDTVPKKLVLIALVLSSVVAGGLYAITRPDTLPTAVTPTTQKTVEIAKKPTSTNPEAIKSNLDSQNQLLQYLIEEEKLAHDVYARLYELHGSKVFGNILRSEQTHQTEVLTLLQARNVPDPRASEPGVFNNDELQRLYNQLVTQGAQNAEEAYKVGVIIEEKDIADITTQLATATDGDIVSALERLRTGSENHLRAFNRQLSRY